MENDLGGSRNATSAAGTQSLALVLGGGGARGAYQAGVLYAVAERFPELIVPIITGVSAGAINTVHLAASSGSMMAAAEKLVALWYDVTPEKVYDIRTRPILRNAIRWGARLLSGGRVAPVEPIQGMVDTSPLRQFLTEQLKPDRSGSLPGIAANLAKGSFGAVAISATRYSDGHSITWVEGREFEGWQRAQRSSQPAKLGVDHVMASSALPMLFPAVRVDDAWFGDGGIRLTSPLSPAVHLGATGILTISTRHRAVHEAAGAPVRYPSPAQVIGVLYGSVFVDALDEDILRLRRINRLLAHVPPQHAEGARMVDILVIRPEKDLRAVAKKFEPRLPAIIRHMIRGLGTKQASNADLLSLILFQSDYVRELIDLGIADARQNFNAVETFLERHAAATPIRSKEQPRR